MEGIYECFNCMVRSVVWDKDFSYKDMKYEGEGVVHTFHCLNCGAKIEYKVPMVGMAEGQLPRT